MTPDIRDPAGSPHDFDPHLPVCHSLEADPSHEKMHGVVDFPSVRRGPETITDRSGLKNDAERQWNFVKCTNGHPKSTRELGLMWLDFEPLSQCWV